MLTRRIIPCLDVLEGRVVKGRKFKELAEMGDPVELSERYSREGADEIVLLDISATIEGRRPFFDMVERVAKRIAIPLTVGGGVRSIDDIIRLLRCGADKVSLNTALVEDPLLLARAAPRVGTQALVAALDVRRVLNPLTGDLHAAPFPTAGRPARRSEHLSREPGSSVPPASDGSGFSGLAERPGRAGAKQKRPSSADAGKRWVIHVRSGTEETDLDAIEWAKTVADCGAGELLVTSIDHDGMRQGYDLELLRELTLRVNIPVIASGGAGTREHIAEALKSGEADAVLAAGIFHAGEISIQELKAYLQSQGIPVRV